MKLLKRLISTLVLVFVLLFSCNAAICEETMDLRTQTKHVYFEFVMAKATGDMTPLLALIDPNIVMIHQGPLTPETPFMQTFDSTDGGYVNFFNWVGSLMSVTALDVFVPEAGSELAALGIPDLGRMMTVEGDVVYSNVLESGTRYIEGSRWAMDNMHIFYYNEAGLVDKIVIIPDSDGALRAVAGESFDPFMGTNPATAGFTPIAHSMDYYFTLGMETSEYSFGPWYNKVMAIAFVKKMERNRVLNLSLMLADDVVCQMPGSQSVPFTGTFVGKNQVKDFIRLVADEVNSLCIKDIVSDGNTVRVNVVMDGENSETGESFVSAIAVITFQFNEDGKIARIFTNYDSFAVGLAYGAY